VRTAGSGSWSMVSTGRAELADAERISRSYVCRVLRLTLLAPDIVERILDGRPTAGLAQFLKPFPVEVGGVGAARSRRGLIHSEIPGEDLRFSSCRTL
jgi:hypothetical protein